MEWVFSVGSSPMLYNDAPRPTELEIREFLEVTVEDD
jgi:hypothetical protein